MSGRRWVIVVAAIAVLAGVTVAARQAVGGGSPRPRSLTAAKPFTLGQLGHPGHRISLAAYAGQPVVLNFFASWCPPCKRETPLLARFYRAHHGQIHVIGVDNNDGTAAALRFVRADQVGYPVAVDPFPADTAVSYGVLNLPQTFLLNARHQIVRRIVGAVTAGELRSWAASVATADSAQAAGRRG